MFAMSMLALVSPSSAQNPADWQYRAGAVLSPQPGISWASQSVSNPSVVYDSVNDRYVMFFEARTPTVDARCPAGVWNIGMATSPDGVAWTVNPTPLIAPDPNSATFYNCVVAHPTAVFNPAYNAGLNSTGVYNVYFKTEQTVPSNACASGNRIFGCGQYTGIGVANVCHDSGGNLYRCKLDNRPALYNTSSLNMGTPHVVYQAPNWRMTLGIYPDIYQANGTWNRYTRAAAPILQQSVLKATVPWVVDELFNPAMVCNDDAGGDLDLAMFVGGRDTQGATTLTGSFGKALSDKNVISWALGATAQQTWAGNLAFRHWDVRKLTNAAGEYVIYFDEKDAQGNNFIRMGTTDPSLTWTDSDFSNNFCNP